MHRCSAVCRLAWPCANMSASFESRASPPSAVPLTWFPPPLSEPAPLTMATSVRSGPSPPSTLRCHPWLSVTPRVSGLQRSQEKSVDLSASEPLATAAASLSLPKGLPPRPSAGPSPKLKAFLVLPEHRAASSRLDFSSRSVSRSHLKNPSCCNVTVYSCSALLGHRYIVIVLD